MLVIQEISANTICMKKDPKIINIVLSALHLSCLVCKSAPVLPKTIKRY